MRLEGPQGSDPPWSMTNGRWLSRRRLTAALLALPWVLGQLWAAGRDATQIRLDIASDGDLLAFKPDSLTCPSGAHVHLVFHHTGKYVTQDHNWVLVRAGYAQAVADAGLKAGEQHGWVAPGDPRVLAATRPCGKGHQASVDFVAPQPGDYPFLCTNPGHGAVMHGVLHVTAPETGSRLQRGRPP